MYTISLGADVWPNLNQVAPIVRAVPAHGGPAFKVIHAGEHYDRETNDIFFDELAVPEPDMFVAACGGSHGQQTARSQGGFRRALPGRATRYRADGG